MDHKVFGGSLMRHQDVTDVGDLHLNDLANNPGQRVKPNQDIQVEHIPDKDTFMFGYNAFSGADDETEITHDFESSWKTMSAAIGDASFNFRSFLTGLAEDPDWQSKTAQAAAQNAINSLDTLVAAKDSANVMSKIVQAFGHVIHETKHAFTQYKGDYDSQVTDNSWGNNAEDNKTGWDQYAMAVLRDKKYKPNIEDLNKYHPDLSGVAAPPPPGPSAVPGGTGGPNAGGAGGGPSAPSGLGAPSIPNLPTGTPAVPNPAKTGLPGGAPNIPAKAASDATKAAGSGLSNAAGQAGNAAQKAMSQAMKEAQKGLARPPEGVLGLGPKGLSGASKTGAGGATRAGGGGGRGPAAAKPANPKLATPTRAAAAATTSASRAGLGGSGAAGAGAPAAGNRGSTVGGGVHKANKALRNRKNGQEVAGDAAAVAPVLGEESKDAAPPKPGTSSA
ncbi:hypothetical protein ACAG26_07720 [Mycobacterium sp. pUA109]|uniref:hypothetical protein n=1 Tax=Mycobacterium sp. pUA109 TaxID=3238982 RepID=UPI00351BA96B